MFDRSSPHPLVAAYAGLFAVGGRRFLLSGLAARLPGAMLPLAVLLYAYEASASFALAGLVVAGLSIGGAAGGPALGALAQRWNPRGALLLATAVAAVVLSVVLLLDGSVVPLAVLIGLASLLGAANGQVGALVRAQWSALLADPDEAVDIQTAMAYETVVDEVSFVLGPAVAGTLAGVFSPKVALASALVLLSAQVLLATMLRIGRRGGRRHGAGRTRIAGMARWLVLGGCVGSVFGIVQTGLTARLTILGQAEQVGVIYAAVGVGSAVSGALTPLFWARWRDGTRVRLAAVGLIVAGVLLATSTSAPLLVLGCAAAGLFVAPIQIAAFHQVERLGAPGETFNITVLSTAMVTGVAAGAAIAGLLADQYSVAAALLAVPGVGVVVVLATARRTPTAP